MHYDLGNGTDTPKYIPPNLRKKEDVVTEVKEEAVVNKVPKEEVPDVSTDSETKEVKGVEVSEKKENKPKQKRFRKRANKTELDKLVDEIIENKRSFVYEIKSLTDDEFYKWEEDKKKAWKEGKVVKGDYNDDYNTYILISAIIHLIDYEQEQKQVYYGVSVNKRDNKTTYSISYDNYMSAKERVEEGYFTRDEKNRIAEKLFPLEQSVYRKYVPGDDIEVSPYTKEEIRDAVYVGIAKALNTYKSLSEKTKVSFSSWAYVCMNNACLDVIRIYTKGKYKGVTVVHIDGLNPDDAEEDIMSDKIEEKLSEQHQETDVYDDMTKDKGRKEFIESVFQEMETFGKKSYMKQQAVILQSYFGLTSGRQMSFLEISQMLNMDYQRVKDVFNEAKENFVKAVYKLGFDVSQVTELFYS